MAKKEMIEIPNYMINVGRKRTGPSGQSFYERFITVHGKTRKEVEDMFHKVDNKISKEEKDETDNRNT